MIFEATFYNDNSPIKILIDAENNITIFTVAEDATSVNRIKGQAIRRAINCLPAKKESRFSIWLNTLLIKLGLKKKFIPTPVRQHLEYALQNLSDYEKRTSLYKF